jgi:hypothetical protein
MIPLPLSVGGEPALPVKLNAHDCGQKLHTTEILMQTTPNVLTAVIKLTAGAALLLATVARAEDTNGMASAADKKSDPGGAWTWTVPARNGGPDRTNTLTLKLDGDKLTGKLSTPGRDGQVRESTIADGKVSGDEISFSVTREFNGNSFTSKYSGKVSGDAIAGKMEFERNGETQSRDWNASRVKETPGKAAKPEMSDQK